jgi:hypothetical protein
VNTEAAQPRGVELFAKAFDAIFEPRAGHRETELRQANVE